jgi:hypothetical protein
MRTREQGKEGGLGQGSRNGRPVPKAPAPEPGRAHFSVVTSSAHEDPAEVLGLVMAALADQGHYLVELDADEHRLHELVERAGRQAGYLLGRDVRTARSRPMRRHRGRTVAVLVARTDSEVLQSLTKSAARS